MPRRRHTVPHWSEDRYWTEALDRYAAARQAGRDTLTLDLRAIDEWIAQGDGPAYRLVDAMCSVKEQEAWDGYRGAPRLVMALLELLAQASVRDAPAPRREPRPWPKNLPQQMKAVVDVLQAEGGPHDLETLAMQFTGTGQWRKRLHTVLEALVALGQVHLVEGVEYWAADKRG